MTCHELERLLDAYVDDELGLAESASCQEHLASCAACRQRLADRESLGRLVRSAPYHVAPDRLRTAIVAARKRPFDRGLLAWAAIVTMIV